MKKKKNAKGKRWKNKKVKKWKKKKKVRIICQQQDQRQIRKHEQLSVNQNDEAAPIKIDKEIKP